MANTIGFGQAAVNNTIDYGQGAIDNTINWGKSQTLSPSGETNITGTGGTPPFSNVNSFSFDGVDDYFIGTSTYSELDGQNKATISLWAKFDNLNSARILTSLTRNSNVNDFVFMLCNIGNTLRFFTSSTTQYTYSNAVLTSNTWLHIMIAIDKTQGISATRCKIFINGQDETSAVVNQDGTALQTSNSSLYIGENQNGKYNPMLGKIDELAIWSGTDLRNDVATIYNNGTPTDLNNNGLTAPTTWQRMGEDATWNGATWTMTDVNGSYTNRSINMVEANRTTDVPSASSFTNTKSILLDGIDDFVSVTNSNILDGLQKASWSFWFKKSGTSAKYLSGHYNNGNQFLFLFIPSSNRIDGYVNGVRAFNSNSTTISVDTWYNAVFVLDSTLASYPDRLKLFINGTQIVNSGGATLPQNATLNSDSGDILIGKNTTGFNWDGNIDEVSFWNDAKTISDIWDGSGIPTDLSSKSNLLAWWRMGDGDTAPILSDNGSGGNDGTMTNFTTFSTDVPT